MGEQKPGLHFPGQPSGKIKPQPCAQDLVSGTVFVCSQASGIVVRTTAANSPWTGPVPHRSLMSLYWLHPHQELIEWHCCHFPPPPLEAGKSQAPRGESLSQPHSHTASRPSLPNTGDDGPSSVSKGTPMQTWLGVGASSLPVTDRRGSGVVPMASAHQPEGGFGVYHFFPSPVFPWALSLQCQDVSRIPKSLQN